jgi:hypothetical protein
LPTLGLRGHRPDWLAYSGSRSRVWPEYARSSCGLTVVSWS